LVRKRDEEEGLFRRRDEEEEIVRREMKRKNFPQMTQMTQMGERRCAVLESARPELKECPRQAVAFK